MATIVSLTFTIVDNATGALKAAYDVAVSRGLAASDIGAPPANLFNVSTTLTSSVATATLTPSNDALHWIASVLAKATTH